MGTSMEEIARQHRAAYDRVEQREPYAVSTSHDEIPLSQKRFPLYQLIAEREQATTDKDHSATTTTSDDNNKNNNNDNNKEATVPIEGGSPLRLASYEDWAPYWSSRGTVDVTALQTLVREGYNRPAAPPPVDENQSTANTSMTDETASTTLSSSPSSSAKVVKGKNTKGVKGTNKNAATSTTKATKPKRLQPISLTDYWDPVHAASHNVSLCRPSHDAWGIHKIILLFCDDFLRHTYALPWWHGDGPVARQWRAAVQPILQVLGLDSPDAGRRIVRLLLASLPPNVTIPVHEDSGAWVAQTHRVHVPILVQEPDRIWFACGPTVETLQRIPCTPGHVFEINNQAKHAVSNCSSDHRVHLILDYVDANHPQASSSLSSRILLDPGEVLWQTRRSVDRWRDRGSRPTPSYMILGVQKAGTTSLYEYLVQHPLVVRAKRRETHCFDWRWNPKLKTVQQQRQWCHNFFHTQDLHRHPSCLTGDSTPSYLLDARRVIPRIQRVLNWPLKFFVMLRHPVARAQSHYAMVTSLEGTPAQLQTRGSEWREKSFRQVVMDDIQTMQTCGLIPYWDTEQGRVDEAVWQQFSGSAEEDQAWDRYLKDIPLNTGSHSLLTRGLYELNLRPWFRAFDRECFLVLRLEDFKTQGVSVVMERVWKHLDLPPHTVEDESAKNTRSYDNRIDDDLQAYLERFFEPHNRRLADVLGSDWRGVWETATPSAAT